MRVSKTAIKTAADRLRALVLAAEDGALIGSEDSLIVNLGFSRSTVRQVARLLEREGLLRVRRGINGGYFGARPDESTVEAAVSAYLETLELDPEDVTTIASALWVEVVRKATHAPREAARTMTHVFRERVLVIKAHAPFAAILALELESRAAIFKLAHCRYIELIFQINMAFAGRCFPPPIEPEESTAQSEFVRAWRDAKLMELTAIAEGDEELGMMAARHIRNLWQKRVWQRRKTTA